MPLRLCPLATQQQIFSETGGKKKLEPVTGAYSSSPLLILPTCEDKNMALAHSQRGMDGPRAGVGLKLIVKVPVRRARRSFNCAYFFLIRKKIYIILAPPLNIHPLKVFVRQTHFLNLCNHAGTFQTTKDEARAKACNFLFYLDSHHTLARDRMTLGFLFCFVFWQGGGDFVF